MPQTPVSPQTSYCAASDFVKRYDVRSIGDRLQDLGIRVTAANVVTDPNLAALLLQASGMLESAILRGNRYAVADLQIVANASPATTGSEYIKGLVADIALWLIYNRRVNVGQEIPKQAALAMETLELLAGGARILPLQESMTAGKHTPIVAPNFNQPTAIVLPLPLSQRTLDYFGDVTGG